MTATKGNVAEAMVLTDFVDLGFEVSVPFGSGQPYDLVVDLGDVFMRVQCKTAWLDKRCVEFNSKSTDHGRGCQSYLGVADAFGVYFPPSKSVFLVPVVDIPGRRGRLRLEPARNNQRKRVRIAADYALQRWSADDLRRICRESRLLSDA